MWLLFKRNEFFLWKDRQKEQKNGIRIEQTIYVEREGQKSIVLGKNGQMIKKVGERARYELSKLFEMPVHLFLFVKVKENWVDDQSQYSDWGLDFNAWIQNT